VLLYNTPNFNLDGLLMNARLSRKEEIACREILKLTQTYLRSIFEYYETSKALTLTSYIKCLQEMGATPQLVKPQEANDIYKVCAGRPDQMTFTEFQESFLGIVIGVHFQCNIEGAERLVYLLEKLCESKRGEILMKKNLLMVKEHPLYMLRLTFGNVYR
jgi:hypothetical protein